MKPCTGKLILVSISSRGVFNMASMISGMILLAISSIVLANVFIVTVKGANTDDYTAAEVALWSSITLVAIAGFVVGILNVFGLN